MYINHCSYIPMPQRELRSQPRDRYITYFQDLHRISKKELDEESFYTGDQYAYTDILDSVIESNLPIDNSTEISDVVFSYWTPEWDPSYSAFATYFLWKTGIQSEVFDVCDVGSIASSTAINILFNTDSKTDEKTKILIGMEQTSIPRCLKDNNLVPKVSSGSIMFLNNGLNDGASHRVEDSVYVNENIIYSSSYAVTAAIEDLIKKHELAYDDCTLILNRGQRCFKELDYLTDKKELAPELLRNAKFCSGDFSVNHLAMSIKGKEHDDPSTSKPIWIYLDEDAESLNTTITMLRKL